MYITYAWDLSLKFRNHFWLFQIKVVTVAYRYRRSPLNASDVNGCGLVGVPSRTRVSGLEGVTVVAGWRLTDSSNAIKQNHRYDG